MQRKIFIAVALAFGVLTSASAAAPVAERATAKEAEALVKKGVALINSEPHEKAFAEISDPKGPFVDRDLYLVVYRLDGVNLAHGFNKKFIGKNMIDLRDADGKPFQRERAEMAKTQSSFWQDLKFVDPLTKKIIPKQTYCERTADMLVCGGIYKP
jgi:cytochrome c